MILRSERPADERAIRALTKAAFAGAPHASGTEAAIIDALRREGALTLSLVAEDAQGIVAHLCFSPVQIGGLDCGWFGLGPVSVAEDGDPVQRASKRKSRGRSSVCLTSAAAPIATEREPKRASLVSGNCRAQSRA